MQMSKSTQSVPPTEVIDRDSYEPAYAQLANILRRQVAAGLFRPGDQLPSEAMLCRSYQISPMTVRRTINMLAEEDPHLDTQGPIVLHVTMQEVANWAGMQISEVQKILTHLNKLGKVELFNDRIHVKNIRDFQRVVNSKRKDSFG